MKGIGHTILRVPEQNWSDICLVKRLSPTQIGPEVTLVVSGLGRLRAVAVQPSLKHCYIACFGEN
jgi:hypothetical protein